MADAFQCDDCGGYYDGKVFETLYNWVYYSDGASDTTKRVELCENCSYELGNGPPDLENQNLDSMR